MGTNGHMINEIQFTVEYYPKLGKKGWLFWANRYRSEPNEIKETKSASILKNMKEFEPVKVLYGRHLDGFFASGRPWRSVFPIFVRIKDEKTLKKIEYIFSFPKILIYRNELLDI
ncbi:hypothetical protein LCGC14_1269610 [marine sediment metagenome]|uniref:Uncharacterized protein n=1 Tax=marine sediment metagenome TaxID=412755 RepID=A0A0F9LJI3_9ZZZZ